MIADRYKVTIQNVRVRGREAEKPDRLTDRQPVKANKDREGRKKEKKHEKGTKKTEH